MTQSFAIPLRLVSEANQREHWSVRSRRRRAHRSQVALVAKAKFKTPTLPCTIRMTRVAPRQLDSDNLVSSFKASRDGLADWLSIDDRTDLISWEYRQERGAPKFYGLRVEVISP